MNHQAICVVYDCFAKISGDTDPSTSLECVCMRIYMYIHWGRIQRNTPRNMICGCVRKWKLHIHIKRQFSYILCMNQHYDI